MPPISVPRPSVRSPADISAWLIFLPVRSDSAGNMPTGSIIPTTITSVMVRIITRVLSSSARQIQTSA